MIVNYDPLHQVVTLDLEDGKPPLELAVGRLIVSYDLIDVSVVAAMERDLEISFIPMKGAPIDVLLRPTGERRWLVQFSVPE